MNAQLRISLLGEFSLVFQGKPVSSLSGDRPVSLLAYLLLHRHTAVSRQHLAFTLWPDSSDSQARANLRNLFYTLRQTLPDADSYLAGDSMTLQWRSEAPLELDVAAFEAALAAAQTAETDAEKRNWLETAVTLYKGDLLPGNYDDWIIPLRETLRQAYLDALHQLMRLLEEANDYRTAARYGQRLLQSDPLDERAYVQLMRLHALSGDRAGVRRLYETCVTTLRRELDVEPGPATQAAYEQLLRLETPVTAVVPPSAAPDGVEKIAPAPPRPRPLPIPATPFIGREAELAHLAERLADPDCRLLTILGLGGMGKTRLALQTAVGHHAVFRDGVAYASLTPLRSADHLIPALAESLNFSFAGPAAPLWQLLNFLHQKEMLLVLDNFEHLLEAATLLSEILAQAPGIKFLVTSRQRLNLVEEWAYELQGLSILDHSIENNFELNNAAQLFVQSARRMKHDFALTEMNQTEILRICRLVGGMPLGLELAASWVRALSCAEIAEEIERNLDFLAISTRNIEKRHHSMRAVFDPTWHLLTPEEQRVLKRFSVFRGEFSREAAYEVAGATLTLLSGLVEKMLVYRSGNTFYKLHELVRQFAANLLQEDVQDEYTTGSRHAAYYLMQLQTAQSALQGTQQKEALAKLNHEIDNIRAAWEFATSNLRLDLIQQAAWPLWYFYELSNYFQEGDRLMVRGSEVVRAKLDSPEPDILPQELRKIEGILGDLLAHRAFFCLRMGRNMEAVTHLEASIVLLRPLNQPASLAHALAHYGLACWQIGRFEDAANSLRESLPLSEATNQRWQMPLFTAFLGAVVHELGNYEEAYQLLGDAMSQCRALGDPRLVTFTASYFSRTAQLLGRTAEAHPHLEEGLRLATETHDRFGIGLMLERLAVESHERGDLIEADRLFAEALSRFQEIGDHWSLSRTLHLLGQLNLSQNAWENAEKSFLEAFRISMAVDQYPVALEALAGLAMLFNQRHRAEAALELTVCIRQHSASPHAVNAVATRLYDALTAVLSQQQVASIEARGTERPFPAFLPIELTKNMAKRPFQMTR